MEYPAMASCAADGVTMARKQKTFFLPDDLCEVVQAYADKRGTSFTKLVTAALLNYLSVPIIRDSPTTMTIAVDLEKGKVNIAQAFLAVLQGAMQGFDSAKVSDRPKKNMSTEEVVLNFYKHSLKEAIADLHAAIAGAENPTKAVIAVLAKQPSYQEMVTAAFVAWGATQEE